MEEVKSYQNYEVTGTSVNQRVKRKNMIVAYALWMLFGLVGIHRFYIGRPASGLAMLGIFLASIPLISQGIGLIGLVAIAVWSTIDGLLIPGYISEYHAKAADSMT